MVLESVDGLESETKGKSTVVPREFLLGEQVLTVSNFVWRIVNITLFILNSLMFRVWRKVQRSGIRMYILNKQQVQTRALRPKWINLFNKRTNKYTKQFGQ